MKKFLYKIWPFLLIFLLSFPAYSHLLKPGFFPMHDDTQVARVAQMAKSLNKGQFPVRWVDDLGYGFGYPIFNFYNPLPYYFGAFWTFLAVDALVATKIMFLAGFLLAGVSMFLFAKHFFGEVGGILSALSYLYAPYHAVQVYVRGSVAEFWAYGILPLVFLGIIKGDIFLGGISLALLILSHNLTAIITLPIIAILSLILIFTAKTERRKAWLHGYMATWLIGLSLSAFFWLPAMVEKKYTAVDQMVSEKFNPLLHFVYPRQFWLANWGFGGSAPGPVDGMSFQIGKLHLLMSFLSFLAVIHFWKRSKKIVRILLISNFYFLISIFMMLPFSRPIWQLFYPILAYLQFPWRFLTFASLSTSFLAGSIVLLVHPWGEKSKVLPMTFKKFSIIKSLPCPVSPPPQGWKFAYSSLIILLILLNRKYFIPKFIYKVKAADFLTEEKLSWETSSISDEYLPSQFVRPKSEEELSSHKFILEKGGKVQEISKASNFYELEVTTAVDNILMINTVYFPGWKAWVDERLVDIDKRDGLINLRILPGKHQVVVKFTDTTVRRMGNIVSLVSFLTLTSFLVYPNLCRDISLKAKLKTKN